VFSVEDQTPREWFRLPKANDYVSAMHDRRPGPVTISRKLTARIRARGAPEVLQVGIARARQFVSSTDELILQALTPSMEETNASSEDLIFRRADPSDAENYARDVGTDSQGTFKQRLSESTNCWLVYTDGRVVHASWTTTSSSWLRELHRYFCPPPGHLYVYESFTRSEVRGRGVYPFALKRIAAWAASEGIRKIWVGVEKDNAASLKSIAKAGFAPAFEVAVERRLGRITVHPPFGPGAAECRGCLSVEPCSARRSGW
jgi:RimJ/RimL family protein N-acetyltransferase